MIDTVEDATGLHIICRDINSQNRSWGRRKNGKNGKCLEQFMDEKNVVKQNDGTPTRFNVVKGNLSCLDLGIVSSTIASKYNWEVDKEEGMGTV